MRQISKSQFDAYCYVRNPAVFGFSEEIMWFEAGERKLLAAIILDWTDKDYGFIILGRDSRKLFRCIYVSDIWSETPEEAASFLEPLLESYVNDGNENYPQGDEATLPNEIFLPVHSEEKLHYYFKTLANEDRFEAARNLIKEIAYSFIDVDGNYIEQFQTTGFDARLWELYLYVFFYNSGLKIGRNYSAPDYSLSVGNLEFFVEAVTVGPNPEFDIKNPESSKEIIEGSMDYMPIKYGSALYSKINRSKQYWEMDHVQGKPFILAVHDYHLPAADKTPGSMTWSRAALFSYLYGVRDVVEFNDQGHTVSVFDETADGPQIRVEKIEFHAHGAKVIPSNFFKQPNSENVSAVLFSNAATLTTFNRMGKLAGLGSAEIKMTRVGMKMVAPNVCVPFSEDVDSEDYEESWGDNVIMYHNPNAKIPLPYETFPEITHIFQNIESGKFEVLQNSNEYVTSVTFIFSTAQKS